MPILKALDAQSHLSLCWSIIGHKVPLSIACSNNWYGMIIKYWLTEHNYVHKLKVNCLEVIEICTLLQQLRDKYMYIVVVIVHGKFLKALLEMVGFVPVVTEDLFFCDKSCDLIYRPGFYRTQYPASYTYKSLGRTPQFTLPASAGTQTCLLCLSLKSRIPKLFRNDSVFPIFTAYL